MRWVRRVGYVAVVLGVARVLLGWGNAADVRYKVKPEDGNLWADRYGAGQPIFGTNRGRVLLTFDDGPDHTTTPRLLDYLDAFGLRAVFFVVGHRFDGDSPEAELNRATLRETFHRGHIIGNHAYSHTKLTDLPIDRVRWEIGRTATLVERLTGVRPRLLRPPYGPLSPEGIQLIDGSGYTRVLWDVDPLDWVALDRQKTAARATAILEQHNGGVLLLHDTHAESVEAVPLIVAWVRARNVERARTGRDLLRFVGVEEVWSPRWPSRPPSMPPWLSPPSRSRPSSGAAGPPSAPAPPRNAAAP